jgi:hypothetical protein
MIVTWVSEKIAASISMVEVKMKAAVSSERL